MIMKTNLSVVFLAVCSSCNLQLKPKQYKKRPRPKVPVDVDFDSIDLVAQEVDVDDHFFGTEEATGRSGDDTFIPVIFHNLKRFVVSVCGYF